MKKTNKKMIALFIITILMLSFIPFKVFAEDKYTYTLTFTVAEGTNHSIGYSMNGETPRVGEMIIDGNNFIALKDGKDNNAQNIGVVNVANDGKSATITVTNGPKGYLNYGGNEFSLFMQGHSVNLDDGFTNNENIAVQDYVEPQQPGQPDTGTSLEISFRDNYEEKQGHVEYSIDNGAHWTEVNTSTRIDNLTPAEGCNLVLKIIVNQGYQLDTAGTEYTENTVRYNLNDNENLGILNALVGQNGYITPNNVSPIRLEGVEFKESSGSTDPLGNNKDYTLVWNSEDKVCFHKYENLLSADTGEINYFKISEITDQSGNNGKITDCDEWGWVVTTELFDDEGNIKQELLQYKNKAAALGFTNENLVGLILYGIDPPRIAEKLGIDISDMNEEQVDAAIAGNEIRGVGTQLLPFGEGNNSFSANVDNNFIMIAYNDSQYAAAYVSENPEDYDYFPAFWQTNTYNANIDISGTTKDSPAYIEAYLLNETVTIQNSTVTSQFISVKPLDVNEDAITVTNKGNGKFEIKFASNYYDRVVFEIKTATNTYYAVIARTSIQVRDDFGPNQKNPKLVAEVYYPTEGYDENSFQVVATTVYKDGTREVSIIDACDILEDRWYVPMEEWGTNLGKKIVAGYNDKVSLSRFTINCKPGGEVIGAYFTVIKKNAGTSDDYAGTFAGSGAGSYYNVETRSVDYSK